MNKERLKKLYTLAIRGVDGERETAERLLNELMKKYGITYEDIDENTVHEYKIEFHGEQEEKLLKQTIYKVTDNSGSFCNLIWTESGRKCRTQLKARCTEAQKIEIEFLFDFYKRLWIREREALFSAFIQKHEIFGHLKEGEKGSNLTPEERAKMAAMMFGLSDEKPLLQIEEA